jgi:uncharacterized protein
MKTKISDGFWHDRLGINARRAIYHQWEQLQASGCIENFRITAGEVDGLRTGYYFADSDAYKWLDAAVRIYAAFPEPRLASLMDDFITLLRRAQEPDGYLFTYNQIHFPGTRWKNLQIEHELYCHGHLIEAGVSHHQSTGRTDLLDIAQRAANRLVEDFQDKGADHTDGHEEIEIALLRLYQVTHHEPYLDLARQLIEQRGRNAFFFLSILKQNAHANQRAKYVRQKKQEYLAAHPEFKPYPLPSGNASKKPRNTKLRWYASALSGNYFQQHAPVRKQSVPVGHAVRFGSLQTAITMLARETGDETLISTLTRAWEHMVTRRMYVTGGIGSVPGLEGFGNDYELDPEYAYAETCAALASMFWNWEMAQLTGEAKYSDLFEWQLYNAAAVGMGVNGKTYLYNNPLTCQGGVTRKPWYAVPCCPSNLSRAWADLGKYVYSSNGSEISIHQFISSETTLDISVPVRLRIESGLPWNGKVLIRVDPLEKTKFKFRLRIPSWSPLSPVPVHKSASQMYGANSDFSYNKSIEDFTTSAPYVEQFTASGYDPRRTWFLESDSEWSPGDTWQLDLDMSVKVLRAHPKVKGHLGKVAITRGPLVYCLESVDNPKVDIFSVRVDTDSLQSVVAQTELGEIVKITGHSTNGQSLTLIPYFLWGNRGASQMTVWVNE